MHLIVKCQMIIGRRLFGAGVVSPSPARWGGLMVIPFGQILNVSNDVRFCQVKLVPCWLIPLVGVHMFFTESLILAQDERWRRA